MSQMPPPADSLWSAPAAPATTFDNGTATSRAAAISARDFSGTQAGVVLACIREAGPSGRTMHEIHFDTGIALQSICARVAALRSEGLITATEKTRPTPSGRKAVVWAAVPRP